MKRKVHLLADASETVGYGHFVRSLALAAYLKDDYDCTIHTAEPTPFMKKLAEGVCALSCSEGGEERYSLFLDTVGGSEIVVPDNYFFKDDFFRELSRRGCRTVKIQDFFLQESCADLVVEPCRSPRWALLREAFLSCEQNVVQRCPGKVAVCFGGSDPLGLTSKYCGILREMGFEPVTFSSKSSSEVAKIFKSVSAVVCSASSVCYEALACGCAVLAGYYVDNQKDFYEQLCRRSMIIPLGDLRECNALPEPPFVNVFKDIDAFRFAPDNYRYLFKSTDFEIKDYTELSPDESRTVWKVRTESAICQWMTDPRPFPLESHLEFVEALKSRRDRLYKAFFLNGEFAGSCNLVDISGKEAERGIFVNPMFQGRGYARIMDVYFENLALSRGLDRLKASVLNVNSRSLAYHDKAGYRTVNRDERFSYFEKSL